MCSTCIILLRVKQVHFMWKVLDEDSFWNSSKIKGEVKVRSAYKLSGSSDLSLSRLLWHEATRSNCATGQEWDASPSQGYSPALSSLVPIYTPGWREALWESSVLPTPARVTTRTDRYGDEALTMRPPTQASLISLKFHLEHRNKSCKPRWSEFWLPLTFS